MISALKSGSFLILFLSFSLSLSLSLSLNLVFSVYFQSPVRAFSLLKLINYFKINEYDGHVGIKPLSTTKRSGNRTEQKK